MNIFHKGLNTIELGQHFFFKCAEIDFLRLSYYISFSILFHSSKRFWNCYLFPCDQFILLIFRNTKTLVHKKCFSFTVQWYSHRWNYINTQIFIVNFTVSVIAGQNIEEKHHRSPNIWYTGIIFRINFIWRRKFWFEDMC